MPAIGTICQYELYKLYVVGSGRMWNQPAIGRSLRPAAEKLPSSAVAINVRSWSMDIASNISLVAVGSIYIYRLALRWSSA